MAERYNPESLLDENINAQKQHIQEQFQIQWNSINSAAQRNMFKSPKEHEEALHELYVKNVAMMQEFDSKAEDFRRQLQQIDKLAEQGAIQNPEEAKWRLVLGPETEQAMFPKAPRDPRLEHRDIVFQENRLFNEIDQFALGRDRRLYRSKVDKDGYYTGQPDKSQPASQQETHLWHASIRALDQMEQRKIAVIEELASSGIPNPNRLQDLQTSREVENTITKYLRDWYNVTGAGLQSKLLRGTFEYGKKFFKERSPGTFANKVEQSFTKSGPGKGIRSKQLDRTKPTGRKLTKDIATRYLLQYGNRQDAMAAARADGYIE